MIDWTDRSEDVLARFEAWKEWKKRGEIAMALEYELMADLAMMLPPIDVRKQIMRTATDETGARLFPDPAEE